MKIGKCALIIPGLLLCFAFSANAQLEGNRLCIHSGGDYYANGPYYGYPNHGSSKYFPSFTHWTSTSVNNAGTNYPWKISGYSWDGMQTDPFNSIFYWESCLHRSVDNPRQPNGWMTWDYPILFQLGLPNTGLPGPVYTGVIPSTVAKVGGNKWIFPSSMGGFNAYQNIFATEASSWTVPTPIPPLFPVRFGYNWGCATANALTIPSSNSIWLTVWTNKSTNTQYCSLDNDSPACDGSGGNKGRNYSLISDADNGTFWGWRNTGNGTSAEWAMCLFVCDAITVPVNCPGSTNITNPFVSYGFDVGAPTITPFMSSLQMSLGFMTEDWANESAGMGRIVLGGMASSGGASGPTGGSNYRIPFTWDALTNALSTTYVNIYVHFPAANYPGCMFGSTIGANTVMVSVPTPDFVGLEIRWASMPANPLAPMSASYMATYF